MINIILLIVSLSFLFSTIQYRIYSNKPGSYIIDKNVLDYYTSNKIETINELIIKHEKEILALDSLLKIDYDTILHTIKINRETKNSSSLYNYHGYFVSSNGYEIYFRDDDDVDEPKPPTESKQSHRIFDFDIISIINDSINIDIYQNKQTKKDFSNLADNIFMIKSVDFKNIIQNTRTFLIYNKRNLEKTKNNIIEFGLPYEIFLFNSFPASIGLSGDYKL